MTDRPILFNDEMVRAILEGRKTQTRRAMKPQPENGLEFTPFAPFGAVNGKGDQLICRWGKPGDRLWVRETFVQYIGSSLMPNGEYESYWASRSIRYAADGFGSGVYEGLYHAKRPSIHMPRWASRITLEITGVRVERLQDISEEDAWNEGVQGWMGKETPWKGQLAPVSVHAFSALWESINGSGSWEANPWVWVIEFRRADS